MSALPDELLLQLAPGVSIDASGRVNTTASTTLRAALQAAGVTTALPLAASNSIYRIRVHSQSSLISLAETLADCPDVVYAEPNYQRELLRDSNDTLFARQDTLQLIHAPEAWDITTGDAIPIAILDTGVSPTHLDLKEKLLPGIDLLNGDDDPRDDEGHGTHMAGVAAASSNNHQGVAGVCWGCTIMPVKVLNRRGRGDDATIAAGIYWAVDHGARIISLSLGGTNDSRTLRDAVSYADQHQVLLVAASGNGQARGNTPNFPAAYPNVLAVAATDQHDAPATFSTSGDFVDIAAPGVGVLSTTWVRLQGDDYGVINGTSPAAPHVAGAAALVWSVRPELTVQQLSDVLMLGADDVGVAGKDTATGYGRLNVARAVQLARDPDLLNRSSIQVQVSGIAPTAVSITLNHSQPLAPASDGSQRYERLAAGQYTITATSQDGRVIEKSVVLSGTALSTATVDLPFSDTARFFQAVSAESAPDGDFYPETGHTLRGAFRDYWLRNGGLTIFGYPISEEFTETSDDGQQYTVQYFERYRFEYHPEQSPPYNVLLARLGSLTLQQEGIDWFSFPKGIASSNCLFFDETGHSLCGDFRDYWQSHGLELDGQAGSSTAESLALFGLPLSEPRTEMLADGRPVTVQWFERARFENHGEDGVLLTLLANDLATRQGWR